MSIALKSITVFHAVVLSIALTLAVGQISALLCKVLCDSHKAASSGCHHQERAQTSVSDDQNCDGSESIAAAFVREDIRRGAAPSDAPVTLLAARWFFVPPPASATSRLEPARQVQLDARPRLVALRI